MSAIRDPRDFYPTPISLVTAFMRAVPVNWSTNPVFDPCCGTGNILVGAQAAGATLVYGSDLYGYEVKPQIADYCRWGYSMQDVTTYSSDEHVVITNPPYSDGISAVHAAVYRCIDRGAQNCALLLRLSMLGSAERYSWWTNMAAPRLMVLSQRPSFGLNAKGKPGTDNSEYAWFMWGPLFKKMPPVSWLKWR